jgi:glutamyl-tRNA synthetase
MVMPDASLVTGFAESTLKGVKEGEVVQLERIGFARLDKKEDGKLRFYYAHK